MPSSVYRPIVLLIAILLVASGLVSRLVVWQVLDGPHLAQMANAQRPDLVSQPLRGQIFDSSGRPLATDTEGNLVYADPQLITHARREASLLAPILGQSEASLLPRLSGFSLYTQLAASVSDATATRLTNLHLTGIVLQHQTVQRDYPSGTSAAQILGFYGAGGANYGLEQYYDGVLAGKAGLRSIVTDTAGNRVRLTNAPSSPSQNGGSIYTSINGFVQSDIENQLRAAVKQHHADGGTVIVMDPRTGSILGMANDPTYNPNTYEKWANKGDFRIFQNSAVSWDYEPGSTFKIVTMAAGLNTHVITPSSAFEDTGIFQVGNVKLHNWTGGAFGWETMTQVLQHSANVGAAYVSSRLGATRFYAYLKRFGIGHKTGIDLPGESAGILPLPGEPTWTIVNQFTNAFGQGVSITPIQLLRAVSAVANHGVMMKPRIVNKIVYRGKVIIKPPVVQGRPITRASANTLTSMLIKSSVAGEASAGLVSGYNVSAKTGTANVADGSGGYIPNDTIASIVGYAPAYQPRFAVLVIINHPRDTPWGSTAAAPVMHNIFHDLFMYFHVPPAAHPLQG